MLNFFLGIIIFGLIIFIIFFNAIGNIVSYILEKIGIDKRTISFIFSIIVVIIILWIFGIV